MSIRAILEKYPSGVYAYNGDDLPPGVMKDARNAWWRREVSEVLARYIWDTYLPKEMPDNACVRFYFLTVEQFEEALHEAFQLGRGEE